ncbi:hypothetical protein P8631_23825, partial [Guyparkeria sp. 1SP6A2]|nr:hypothetical protein [Guyparkeria sp. 1SP6A2]
RQRSDGWLLEQLAMPAVQAWMNIPFERPRLLIPDSRQPSQILMVVPIPGQPEQLLASLHLGELLGNELRLALGPFH